MKLKQVAAQLYTARDLLKTPEDIARTLKRVRDAGYEAVQVSGMGPIPEKELKAILDDLGLVCCATHEGAKRIVTEPKEIAARLKALNCTQVAYPHPAGVDLRSLDSVKQLASDLNEAGRILRSEGITLSYHNHSMEFVKLEGKLILDWIYDLTDPQNLQGELDTYWVHHGGCDNVAWCRKLKNRLPLIHLKDYTPVLDGPPTFCEVGHGNLNFKEIVAAAEAAGCEWFIVEQDTCPGDPVDSLAKSFAYIRDHLV